MEYTLDNISLDFGKITEEILRVVDEVKQRGLPEAFISNQGGTQIHQDVWSKVLTPESYIESTVIPTILNHVNGTNSHWWLNVNYPQCYNNPHLHGEPGNPKKEFSGVYYVKVPEESGDLVFPMTESFISPAPGDLVTFSADVLHGVEPNFSDDIRISLAFNFFPKK